MKFVQHKQILCSENLESPFYLSVVPSAMNKKTRRRKFTCGIKALTELSKLSLDPSIHCGADVVDAAGTLVAEWY